MPSPQSLPGRPDGGRTVTAVDPLERMREQISRRRSPVRRKAWTAPSVDDFAYGSVLSFDQTLSKTGFAVVVHDSQGLRVTEGAVIRHKVPETGFEETYAKAILMEADIEAVVTFLGLGVEEVVHEMPSVQGYRTESSLFAGYFVRRAVDRYARGLPVVMVSKQATAALLVPPDRRTGGKAAVKAAVNVLIPAEQRTVKAWNQDVTDAVANGLYRLHQKKKAQEAA